MVPSLACNGSAGFSADIQSKRPEVGRIYISLVLPRTVNRRLHHSNHRFIKWFNNQVPNYNVDVKKLYRMSSRAFYIYYAFSEMPARHVPAADGLHPSFEGVTLLALHYQISITKKGNRQPAGWSATIPSTRTSDASSSEYPMGLTKRNTDRCTVARRGAPGAAVTIGELSPEERSTSLTDARSPYFLRATYVEATHIHPTQQK